MFLNKQVGYFFNQAVWTPIFSIDEKNSRSGTLGGKHAVVQQILEKHVFELQLIGIVASVSEAERLKLIYIRQ